jgi:retron-type reverse transcriptase
MQQLSLFDIPQIVKPKIELEELFDAYFNCRSNKRNTANAIAFEVDYESNLVKLVEEINNGSYQIGRSIAFIVNKPVKREIFAANFRDRVVHHLIFNKLNPLFEKKFIHDSYSCRVGKGTHFGIQRINKFIRQCSANYTKDCYILKLDLQGFFMSINKNILFEKLEHFIQQKYKAPDKELIIELCRKVIFNDPTQNCTIKGKRSN